jgi:predicted nucleic acid-binding protein
VPVDAVHDELEAGTETYVYLENALAVLSSEIPVITPSPSARELEVALLESLDPGEAQALAVAEATDGTLVTDDGDARTIAEERGVALTGSIGLLVRAVENGLVAAETVDGSLASLAPRLPIRLRSRWSHNPADRYLKRWIDAAGFRSPARDSDVFLEE